MLRQKVKELLKKATKESSEDIDNKIKEIQIDVTMRSIKRDIEQYGYTNGRKLA